MAQIQISTQFVFQKLGFWSLRLQIQGPLTCWHVFQHVFEAVLMTHCHPAYLCYWPISNNWINFSPSSSDWLNVNRLETSPLVMWIFQGSWYNRPVKMIQLTNFCITLFRMHFKKNTEKRNGRSFKMCLH